MKMMHLLEYSGIFYFPRFHLDGWVKSWDHMFRFKLVYKRDNFFLEKLVSHFNNTFSQIWVGPIEIVGGRKTRFTL
jgi:hypothetical protein